jgi:HSP20 family molecular chaperone IbpA
VDVVETAEAFLVTADVPGVPMDAIEITVEKDRLELVAHRSEASHEGHRSAFRESDAGDYHRAFRVPAEIDRGAIRADLRDGVLRITLPKAAPARPQKVLVQAA